MSGCPICVLYRVLAVVSSTRYFHIIGSCVICWDAVIERGKNKFINVVSSNEVEVYVWWLVQCLCEFPSTASAIKIGLFWGYIYMVIHRH